MAPLVSWLPRVLQMRNQPYVMSVHGSVEYKSGLSGKRELNDLADAPKLSNAHSRRGTQNDDPRKSSRRHESDKISGSRTTRRTTVTIEKAKNSIAARENQQPQRFSQYDNDYVKWFRRFVADELRMSFYEVSNWTTYLEREREQFKTKLKKPSPGANVEDFEFLKILGKGSCGQVFLSLKIDTLYFYAIKLVSKETLIKHKLIEISKNEKKILNALDCPFTLKLCFFFQTNVNLYYVLPLVAGLDLYKYLNKVEHMTENCAKFYSSQIVLALEYLHSVGLVYRDLKPENVVMDRTGYLKLADFGFCKVLDGRTYTFCGTPEYIAPEILTGQGYMNSVDWWSFGVILFEFVAGFTPFFATDLHRIYSKILVNSYLKPPHFSSDLNDLIDHLLVIDRNERFGSQFLPVHHIKQHPWYAELNWNGIIARVVNPPFLPDCSEHTISLGKITPEKQKKKKKPNYGKYNKIFQEF